ncbi:ABC transporter ATP-binding protein [Lysinibacter cavernae]|uniref:ABC-2 type transport system ATP-binding protein n=1 Tax=Lysinibacter cavernae TaxID=1640652 RepID=A0A7X5R2I6_9MICO|nr:ABC transporter ATP-binding protein [Lysinibacter cavernae]NIH54312.1 ABC-2 type transport system ATP-binding protein [Lysinibacter cavernae]
MIEAQNLTKRYGSKTAVDGVTFTVRPGQVTGFLGPNGAGKSTTMRMIVGLDRPTHGSVIVNGRPYAQHAAPLHEVGALLDAKAVHTGRSARSHLRALAATHRIPNSRVDQVIEMTGLSSVAGKRVGGFSLGMGQRLGIAAALLGDPQTLILDEPVNGLDPDGVLWVRQLVRGLAAQGKTVLLSSHLMSEMAQTADHIIVLGRGRIIADAPVDQLVGSATATTVRVRTPHIPQLQAVLAGAGVTVSNSEPQLLDVTGLPIERVGELAASVGVVLFELRTMTGSLEDAYLNLTREDVEYQTDAAAGFDPRAVLHGGAQNFNQAPAVPAPPFDQNQSFDQNQQGVNR